MRANRAVANALGEATNEEPGDVYRSYRILPPPEWKAAWKSDPVLGVISVE